MSDNRKYIVKNKPLPVSHNLEALKEIGIEQIKKYSGEIWTDYNDHDPGITVLENVCYAMTEMSYKANFDFKQLFFANGETEEEADLDDYFLLKKHEVLFTNPITEEDYRKLFLDAFGGEGVVKNLWVNADLNLQDHYIVYVCLDKNDPNVKERIEDLYHLHRNFGEKCREIIVLKTESINRIIQINEEQKQSLSEDIIVESIAQFVRDIKAFVEPSIRYAKSLKNLELSNNEIASLHQGPEPTKKFIHPSDLTATSLIRMQEKVNLKTFIDRNNDKWNNIIEIREEADSYEIKRVDIDRGVIAIFNEAALFEEFEYEMKVKIRSLYQGMSIKPLLNGNVEWENYQPHSNILKSELESYYSIQYTFPHNYNLGFDDLGFLDDNSRKQIRNLQAYLVLFESLLVDFLVKIISFPELLKIHGANTVKEVEASFSNILMKIPGATALIKNQDALKNIYKKYSFNQAQQIKLREYALARYGEEFDKDLINKGWGEPKDFEIHWLNCLNKLILEYKNYCQARQNSFNIMDPKSDFPLSKKISILLNKEYQPHNPNIYIIEEHLLDVDSPSSFRVVVVINLKEKEEISEKRREAIKTIVIQELPFHLDIHNIVFLKHLEGESNISLLDLFDLNPKLETVSEEDFMINYQKWRGNLLMNFG